MVRIISIVLALASAALIAACGSGSDDSSNASGASAPSANCTPKHKFTTLKPGTLTVSSYTYAPSTIVKGDKLEGVEGVLLDRVAALECLKLDVLGQGGAGVVPAVQSGRADLAAGAWYRTAARAKVLGLTDPIYEDPMVFVSKNGSVASIDALAGKKVGTFEGNSWNADLQKVMGGKMKIYQTEAAVFQDLRSGRIDVAVDGTGGGLNVLRELNDSSLQMKVPPADPRVGVSSAPGQINWPHTKGNTALTQALNDDILTMRKEGLISAQLKKYGFPPSAITVHAPRLL